MESEEMEMITPYRRKKLNKEMAIYNEWKRLMAEPGAMATRVREVLMEKFDVAAPSTIWLICKRVEARLATGE